MSGASLTRISVFPFLDAFFRIFLAQTVALLKATDQLVTASGNFIELIVGELSPLLFDFSFKLFPVPCCAIPIHGDFLGKRDGMSLQPS